MFNDWSDSEKESYELQFEQNRNTLETALKISFFNKHIALESAEPSILTQQIHSLLNKHWVFFFDVNNTIFIGDSAMKKDKESAICQILAYYYSAIWDSNINQVMSFHDYVTNYACPGSKSDPAVRTAQERYFKNFIPFLKGEFPLETGQAFRPPHALAAEIEHRHDQMKTVLKDSSVLPAFLQFIEFLEKEHYTYTIIFRTLGKDMDQLKQELSTKTPLTISSHGAFKQGQLRLDDGRILKTPAEMLSAIQPFVHAQWDDCWEDWLASGRTYAGGKPFPIDMSDQHVVPIFFDDNVKYQILCIKPCSDEPVDQETLHQELMESGNVVHVEPFEACLNPRYFISKLKYAEQKLWAASTAEHPGSQSMFSNKPTSPLL